MNCLLLFRFRICDLDEQPTCTATQHQYQYKQQLAPSSFSNTRATLEPAANIFFVRVGVRVKIAGRWPALGISTSTAVFPGPFLSARSADCPPPKKKWPLRTQIYHLSLIHI